MCVTNLLPKVINGIVPLESIHTMIGEVSHSACKIQHTHLIKLCMACLYEKNVPRETGNNTGAQCSDTRVTVLLNKEN
jgi:hypothetical protein